MSTSYSDMVIPFGKHAGSTLGDVHWTYLNWIVNQPTEFKYRGQNWTDLAKLELQKRRDPTQALIQVMTQIEESEPLPVEDLDHFTEELPEFLPKTAPTSTDLGLPDQLDIQVSRNGIDEISKDLEFLGNYIDRHDPNVGLYTWMTNLAREAWLYGQADPFSPTSEGMSIKEYANCYFRFKQWPNKKILLKSIERK